MVLLLAALCLLPVGQLIRSTLDRAEARTAADAAALAGALGGRTAAIEIAEANGAEVIDLQWRGTSIEVTVAVGGHRATAQAERVERRREQ